MKTVTIIDYGMSNLRSVRKALEHVAGHEWQIVVSQQATEILQADKVVFPGQGAIGNCMGLLQETGLFPTIQAALDSKPVLGICLGLQTLLTFSEENGGVDGFGTVNGTVRRFAESLVDADSGERLKIPHMGWNTVQHTQPHPLWQGIADNSRFYFVHSYYVEPANTACIAGQTDYGLSFTSVVAQENIFATQFHPEKSQQAGLQLLENFLKW